MRMLSPILPPYHISTCPITLVSTSSSWTCDCNIYPLDKQILSLGSDVLATEPKCAEPSNIKGLHFSSLQFQYCKEQSIEHFPKHFLQVFCGIFVGILLLSLVLVFFKDRIRTHEQEREEDRLKSEEQRL